MPTGNEAVVEDTAATETTADVQEVEQHDEPGVVGRFFVKVTNSALRRIQEGDPDSKISVWARENVVDPTLSDPEVIERSGDIVASETKRTVEQIRGSVFTAFDAIEETLEPDMKEQVDIYKFIRTEMTTRNESAWEKIKRGITARFMSLGARLSGHLAVSFADSWYNGEEEVPDEKKDEYRRYTRNWIATLFAKIVKRKEEEEQAGAEEVTAEAVPVQV